MFGRPPPGYARALREAMEKLQKEANSLARLLNEINCRREHGAAGPEHLKYIEDTLSVIINRTRKDRP